MQTQRFLEANSRKIQGNISTESLVGAHSSSCSMIIKMIEAVCFFFSLHYYISLFSLFSVICSKSENFEFRIICRLVRTDASILEPLSISYILVKFRVSSTHIPHIPKVAEIQKNNHNLKNSRPVTLPPAAWT